MWRANLLFKLEALFLWITLILANLSNKEIDICRFDLAFAIFIIIFCVRYAKYARIKVLLNLTPISRAKLAFSFSLN